MEIGINIQPYLPKDSVNILFSMKDLSTHEKKIAAAKLHRQYCHPPFALLKKKSDVCPVEKDDEFLNILEKYLNCSSVCKRFKPTLPKPAVGYVFDLDKMKFNQVVRVLTSNNIKTNGLFICIYLFIIQLMLLRDALALTLLKKCKEKV